MSYTEIFKFKKNGDAKMFAETKNAFRGAMAVWRILEERYLPEFTPSWAGIVGDADRKYSRVTDMLGGGIKEIWALQNNDNLTEVDMIVLCSTFDNCIVMREDLPKLLEAFRAFDGDTSLVEQAEWIEAILGDEDFIAIGWNQTSVNGDAWTTDKLDKDEEYYLPYNMLKGDEHWDLFKQF